jgi:hypothetical protein
MSRKWTAFAEAARIARYRLNVTHMAAEALLRDHLSEFTVRRDSQLAEQLKATYEPRRNYGPFAIRAAEPGSALDLLAESAAQGALEYALAESPLIDADELLNWLEQRAPAQPLKAASEKVIREAIKQVYDDADKGGTKPPNINELPEPVMSQLAKGSALDIPCA